MPVGSEVFNDNCHLCGGGAGLLLMGAGLLLLMVVLGEVPEKNSHTFCGIGQLLID